jgi:predicted nucleic acid-binding protein
MRVLFDTNVLIDFLLDRAPFAHAASDLLSRVDRGQIQGLACADSFTTIDYLLRRALGKEEARRHVSSLLSLLEVAPVNRATLEQAAESGLSDFEDAVVAESARQASVDCIVTRNERDFAGSRVTVCSPRALQALLAE